MGYLMRNIFKEIAKQMDLLSAEYAGIDKSRKYISVVELMRSIPINSEQEAAAAVLAYLDGAKWLIGLMATGEDCQDGGAS